jgi:hypothetical protein
MRGRLLCFAAVAAATTVAAQGQRFSTLWTHNGSVMRMEADGARRVIVYEKAREALLKTDVSSGATLFRGERVGDEFRGEAYTFKLGCSPAPYPVSGRIEGGRRLVLRGRAPTYDPGSCAVAGYTADSPHARLVFEMIRGASPD